MSTTATTTVRRKTATQTSSTQPSCTWSGHCLGDRCSTSSDCDRDWTCVTGYCTVQCGWPGHCIGDQCQSFNDCDQDWVCSNKKCAVCTECDEGGSGNAAATSSISTQASRTLTGTALTESASSTSRASLPSPTAAADHISTPVAIGMGVAIAVAVIAIIMIVYFGWRVRRKRRARREQARHGQSGPSELDWQNRVEMRDQRSPVEMASGQSPQELDQSKTDKHVYAAQTQPPEPMPVEIDGREFHYGEDISGTEKQSTAYGSHTTLGDRHTHSRVVDGLQANHMLQTPSSGISSPSRPPTAPALSPGFAVSPMEELSNQDQERDFSSNQEQPRQSGDRRRKLRRKSGG